MKLPRFGFTARDTWLERRYTPRNLWRRLGRYVWMTGTYVRERFGNTSEVLAENVRLAAYQSLCNRNYHTKRQRRKS